MKYVLGRTVIFCAVLLLFPVAARGDLITITISQPLTVNLITSTTTVPFHNKIVTYKAMLTTESLAACDSPNLNYGCIYNDEDPIWSLWSMALVHRRPGRSRAPELISLTSPTSSLVFRVRPIIHTAFQLDPAAMSKGMAACRTHS